VPCRWREELSAVPEPWISVALWRYSVVPNEGWDLGKWDAGHWDGGLSHSSQWTDITCDVRGLDISRGRQAADVAGGVEVGVLQLDLDNRDGQWSQFIDPGDGKPIPMLASGNTVRVTATDGVSTWYYFLGQIEGWVQEWSALDDVVHVTASDDWRRFSANAAVEWTPGPIAEMVPNRLRRLLLRANWPKANPIYLQGSSTTLLGSKVTNTGIETGLTTRGSIAEEILLTALSDGGKAFVDANGGFVYLNRNWRQSGPIPAIGARPAQASVPLFGDYCDTPQTGELPYSDLEWEYDGTAPVGAVALANEPAPSVRNTDGVELSLAWPPIGSSKAGNFAPSVLTLGGLRFRTQAEADALAAYYLDALDDAYLSARRLEVYPHLDDRLWAITGGLRIGDHIKILRRERLNTLNLEVMIEGIHLTITPDPARMSGSHHFGQWLFEYVTSTAVVTISGLGATRELERAAATGAVERSGYGDNAA